MYTDHVLFACDLILFREEPSFRITAVASGAKALSPIVETLLSQGLCV